ncbi:MAG: hypothetical protein ACTSO9_19580 [Candidatus Helarchaeota archaeon]
MVKAKTAFTFFKYFILIYGLSVSGLSFMIGLDASQLSYPPGTIPHPALFGTDEEKLAYFNSTERELIFTMSNNGFLYKFIVPTIIVIYNGTYLKNPVIRIPKIFNITEGPLILPPKSMVFFTITLPQNISNPIYHFAVFPQVWLFDFKIMEFQLSAVPRSLDLDLNFSITL